MKPIKIAILNLNHGHARAYYQTLRAHKDFELVAVSVDRDNREKLFLEQLDGIAQFPSDEALLDAHKDLEAVVIASPNALHAQQVRQCAERGIHIFSMKVPTFDLQEYDEMIRLTEANKIVFQIELELHYNPTMLRLKEIVDSGKIGKILSIQAVNLSHYPGWWLPWHGVPEESYGKRMPLGQHGSRIRGGALADHPHIFDAVRYLTGSEFATIFAHVAPNLRPDLEVEDMLSAVATMQDGTIVSLDPSYARLEHPMAVIGPGWEKDPKRVEVTFVVNGEQGTIMADCFHPNIYHTGKPNHGFVNRYCNGANCRMPMLDEFARCIRTGELPKVNLRRHRPTMQAMNACYDSIDRQEAVRINTEIISR